MRWYLRFLFFLVTAIQFICSAQAQTEPIRGLRIDSSYFYSLYPGMPVDDVVHEVIRKAQSAGVNTLFIYAYNGSYGAFYPTSYPMTAVESGYGAVNIARKLAVAAKAVGMRTVAVVPVNDFKVVWEQKPTWRAKLRSGADYVPVPSMHLLSVWHTDFRSWLAGLYKDLLTQVPEFDGVEAVEPFIDYNWQKEADYHPIANNRFKAAYPSARLGDAKWVKFRPQGLTEVIALMNDTVKRLGKMTYLVQTWPAKPDGTLHSATTISDNIGLDFNAILNLTGSKKLDYLMAEFMWQQWAAEYGTVSFDPYFWTRKSAHSFKTFVNGRSIPLVHVEISNFTGTAASITPSLNEFETSLASVNDLAMGVDVYDYAQLSQVSGGFAALLSWFQR